MRHSFPWRLGAYLFICSALVFVVFSQMNRPHIFVLHSYSPVFTWVDEVNRGIGRVLAGRRASVRYQYLDAKRHPSAEDIARAAVSARRVIDEWRPDVVIASDDIAQEFVAKEYVNDPRIKIVFCGVNATAEKYGYDKASNVTGILERLPIAPVHEALRVTFYPDHKRLAHIADHSETSVYLAREITDCSWQPFEFVGSTLCRTFDDWKAAVLDAQNTADLLLITHYHSMMLSDSVHIVVPPEEVVAWTRANSHIPAVGSFGFFVQDGGALSYAISAVEQGEEAAKMAWEIAENGRNPAAIPVMQSRQFMIYARESELRREGIVLPVIYEDFARAANTYWP